MARLQFLVWLLLVFVCVAFAGRFVVRLVCFRFGDGFGRRFYC